MTSNKTQPTIKKRRLLLFSVISFLLYIFQALIQNLLAGSFDFSDDTARFLSYLINLVIFGIIIYLKNSDLIYPITWKNENKISPYVYGIVFLLPLLNVLQIINSPFFDNNILLCIIMGLHAGFVEEIIFRGFIFQGLIEKQNINTSIIISSIIFGLFHLVEISANSLEYVILQVVYATAIGVVFSCIVVMTRSILPVIICHALIDILAGFVLEVSWRIDFLCMIFLIIIAVLCFHTIHKQKINITG